MADLFNDPYAAAESDDERRAIYARLTEDYERKKADHDRIVYDSLIKDWDKYRAQELEQSDKFTKTAVMLSAGAFGVSFAFVDKIAPFAAAVYKPVLVGGWGCFALTLVCSLLCYLVSSIIHGKYCDGIAENMTRGYDGRPFQSLKKWYSEWITLLSQIVAFIGFLGGMACLVIFVTLNA
jgi:hypothetical protein